MKTQLNPVRVTKSSTHHPSSLLLSACLILTAITIAHAGTSGLPVKNPGMEEGTTSPTGWAASKIEGVELRWDRSVAHQGKASLCLKKTAQRFWPLADWSQEIKIEPAKTARQLKIQCWVKAENAAKAVIDVTYSGAKEGHGWAAYIGAKQPTDPKANHDWKLYEGTVSVPAGSDMLGIAFQIYGPGTVWFDDLQVSWKS
jgi:RNA polymerase sigma-70 factor (ECF subfamily)